MSRVQLTQRKARRVKKSLGGSSLRLSLSTPEGEFAAMIAGLCAGEVDFQALHADGALDGSAVEGAVKNDIGGRTLDGNIDGEAEFIDAEIAADDGGVAARAAEGAGKRAVTGHGNVDGRFLRSFGSGVGELPLAGEIALGRILGFFRLANSELAAIDEDNFDFGFFVEEIAIGYDEVGDFAGFNGAQAVRDAKDFGSA